MKKDFGDTRSRKPDISSLVYGKVPPQAIEAEEAVLGALMLESQYMDEVLSLIPHEDCFYVDANQKIYAAIRRVKESGSHVDQITVAAELTKSHELELIGGNYYLAKLTDRVSSTAKTVFHACIVMEKYMLRAAIQVSGGIINDAYDDADPFDLQERFITEMNAIYEAKSASGWVSISEVARAYLQEREDRRAGRAGLLISTTIQYVDNKNVGYRGGDFILIAARPGVGKSAFVLPVIRNTAKNHGAVGVVNLEMGNTQTFGRMMAHETGVGYTDLEQGYNIGDDKLIDHVGELSKLPVFFSKAYSMNINSIVASVNWLIKKKGAKLVVIDYLQLIEPSKQRSREQEVSQISRSIKMLAMAHQIPIIALSQLNRDSANRSDKRPQIQDLRESGSLEQDADVVILLHRDWQAGIVANENGSSTEKEADLIVAKWRNGRTGEVKLHFDGPTMKFSEVPEEVPFAAPAYDNPRAGFQSYRPPYNDNDL